MISKTLNLIAVTFFVIILSNDSFSEDFKCVCLKQATIYSVAGAREVNNSCFSKIGKLVYEEGWLSWKYFNSTFTFDIKKDNKRFVSAKSKVDKNVTNVHFNKSSKIFKYVDIYIAPVKDVGTLKTEVSFEAQCYKKDEDLPRHLLKPKIIDFGKK